MCSVISSPLITAACGLGRHHLWAAAGPAAAVVLCDARRVSSSGQQGGPHAGLD